MARALVQCDIHILLFNMLYREDPSGEKSSHRNKDLTAEDIQECELIFQICVQIMCPLKLHRLYISGFLHGHKMRLL